MDPSHGRASVSRPVRTYLQQFCTDTRCSLEDLPEAKDAERELGKTVLAARYDVDIYIYIYMCVCVCVCVILIK